MSVKCAQFATSSCSWLFIKSFKNQSRLKIFSYGINHCFNFFFEKHPQNVQSLKPCDQILYSVAQHLHSQL